MCVALCFVCLACVYAWVDGAYMQHQPRADFTFYPHQEHATFFSEESTTRTRQFLFCSIAFVSPIAPVILERHAAGAFSHPLPCRLASGGESRFMHYVPIQREFEAYPFTTSFVAHGPEPSRPWRLP